MTTRRHELLPHEHRALAALFAATLGVLICLGQRHFTLSLTHPSSFLAAAHHRCALCLYAAFTWLFLEALSLTLSKPGTSNLPT